MLDDPLPFRPAAGLLALSIQCCCSFSYTLHFWDLLQKRPKSDWTITDRGEITIFLQMLGGGGLAFITEDIFIDVFWYSSRWMCLWLCQTIETSAIFIATRNFGRWVLNHLSLLFSSSPCSIYTHRTYSMRTSALQELITNLYLSISDNSIKNQVVRISQ